MKPIYTVVLLIFSLGIKSQIWVTKAPMPAPRVAAGACVINNIIYVAGGNDGITNTSSLFAYDPSTNTWTTKASMNVPRTELVVAAVNNKLYAIGGYSTNGAVNTVEEYDPVSNTWTQKAAMPTARSVMSGGVINNKIYIVGGWPGNIAALEEFDPAANVWTTKTACALGRQQINGAAAINGKMYFVGGKNDVNTTWYSQNESYDVSLNQWAAATALPQNIFGGSICVFNGSVHYLGGTASTAGYPNFKTHYVYNNNLNTWSNSTPLLNKRSMQVAVAINNKMYVIGGMDSTGVAVNWNEEFSISATSIRSEHKKAEAISAFPNPSNSTVTIALQGYANHPAAHLQIFNSIGWKIEDIHLEGHENYVVDEKTLAPGIYFYIVISEGVSTSPQKFVIIE